MRIRQKVSIGSALSTCSPHNSPANCNLPKKNEHPVKATDSRACTYLSRRVVSIRELPRSRLLEKRPKRYLGRTVKKPNQRLLLVHGRRLLTAFVPPLAPNEASIRDTNFSAEEPCQSG